MKIKTLEVYGLIGLLESLRLPYKKEVRSIYHNGNDIYIDEELNVTKFLSYCDLNLEDSDLKLIQKLIKAGDEHAKALRIMRVDCKIKTTRYIWSELDTYEIGVVNGCSESTMHTILNEDLKLEHFQYSKSNLDTISKIIDDIYNIKTDSTIAKNEKTIRIKEILPESYLQERVISFSYQTLQRIVKQRSNHRLPQWQNFIKWVETLPLSNELIFKK